MDLSHEDRISLLDEAKAIRTRYASLIKNKRENQTVLGELKRRYAQIEKLLSNPQPNHPASSVDDTSLGKSSNQSSRPRLPTLKMGASSSDEPELFAMAEIRGKIQTKFIDIRDNHVEKFTKELHEDLLLDLYFGLCGTKSLDGTALIALALVQRQLRRSGYTVGGYPLTFLREKILNRFVEQFHVHEIGGRREISYQPSSLESDFDPQVLVDIFEVAWSIVEKLLPLMDSARNEGELDFDVLVKWYVSLMGRNSLSDYGLAAMALVIRAFRLPDADGLHSELQKRIRANHSEELNDEPTILINENLNDSRPQSPNRNTQSTVEQEFTANRIDVMNGHEFETLTATLLRKMGFNVTMTKQTGDGGIDLIVKNESPVISGTYVVQCKRTSQPVGEPVVRDLYGVITSEQANKGILICTNKYTSQAQEFAKGKPIELIDGSAFNSLLRQYELLSTFVPEELWCLTDDPAIAQLLKIVDEEPQSFEWRFKLLDALLELLLDVRYGIGPVTTKTPFNACLKTMDGQFAAIYARCKPNEKEFFRFLEFRTRLYEAASLAFQGRVSEALDCYISCYVWIRDHCEANRQQNKVTPVTYGLALLNIANLAGFTHNSRGFKVSMKHANVTSEATNFFLSSRRNSLKDTEDLEMREAILNDIKKHKLYASAQHNMIVPFTCSGGETLEESEMDLDSEVRVTVLNTPAHLSLYRDVIFGNYGYILSIREDEARAISPSVEARLAELY